MATTYVYPNDEKAIMITTTTPTTAKTPRACFSFAAYANTVITSLQYSDVHVAPGLTEPEISAIESAARFTFPPDLRSILSVGLPVGPGFPNWRSSSAHQLSLLSSLPILSLSKEVSRNNFWVPSWGPRPINDQEALTLAHTFLGRAPPLVPIFRHCYIPSEPNLAGNPVFYVRGGDVRILSVDVGGFFMDTEFWKKDLVFRRFDQRSSNPAWAGAARKVEFWSEAAEIGSTRRRWWSGELGGCLEDVMWRLRDGGWGEEEVREMMMMDNNGEDEHVKDTRRRKRVVKDKEGVVRHVRSLSLELLRGGWSMDDVVYSLGECQIDKEKEKEKVKVESEILEGESWVDFQCSPTTTNKVTLLMRR